MIKRLEKSGTHSVDITALKNDFKSGFFNTGNISTWLIILIITCTAVTAVYFVSGRIYLNFYRQGKGHEMKIKTGEPYSAAILEDYVRNKNYSSAVLYLYHYAIMELKNLNFPVHPGMTDMMIHDRIREPGLSNAFKTIYLAAEEVLFSDNEATERELDLCMQSFEALKGKSG